MIYSLGDLEVKTEGEYWVAGSAAVIGQVILKDKSSVWFNAVLRGDNEPITVGEGTNIQDGAVLHTDPGFPMLLGPHVTVGHKVMILVFGKALRSASSTQPLEDPTSLITASAATSNAISSATSVIAPTGTHSMIRSASTTAAPALSVMSSQKPNDSMESNV